jgi:hypothetical protein
VEIVLKHLSHRLEEYRCRILQIIVGIGAQCATILDHRDDVHPKALNMLKNIRQLAVVRLKQVSIKAFTRAFNHHSLMRISHKAERVP